MVIFVGCLIFTVVVVGCLTLFAAGRRQYMDELSRLSRHQRKLSEKQSQDEVQNIFLQQRQDDYLSRLLALAGLEAQYDQIKTQWIAAGIGGGLLLGVLGWIYVPDLAILGFPVGLGVGFTGYKFYLERITKMRQEKMTEQLPQVLETMSSALRAGSPVMETFKVLSETAADPIRGEFRRALVALQLGKSFRECVTEMTTRIRTPDFELLAQAIFISQDVGANLADVVSTIAETIRERFKLRNYMNALTAQGKATAAFIGFLPYGITAMTFFSSPAYMIPFFNHPIARLITILLVIWECIGFWILIKMTTFEV